MKFGVQRVEITPAFRMLMGGYDSRLDHFDGVHDPLTFTAVYLNDGRREAWIGSADLCQFPDDPYFKEGAAYIAGKLGCRPEALFLNASHTHGGPLTRPDAGVENGRTAFRHSPGNRALILQFLDGLWRKIADAMAAARDNARPGTLHYTQTPTHFPLNRRKTMDGKTLMAPNPDGPIDGRLRLFAIRDTAGTIRVLLPILACHPTSTSDQHLLTADYVGAWRQAVETRLSGPVQMAFLQACCGDARPAATAEGDHWRIVRLNELSAMAEPLYNQTLAAINGPWHDCGPLKLAFGVQQLDLPCETTYATREALENMRTENQLQVDYVQGCLNRLSLGKPIADTVSFPLNMLQLTERFSLLGMNCEPLCGLGSVIEAAFGPDHATVLGYTGGCLCYVPNEDELSRGGYETESYLWGPMTGPFKPGIDQRFVDACRQLRQQIQT